MCLNFTYYVSPINGLRVGTPVSSDDTLIKLLIDRSSIYLHLKGKEREEEKEKTY